MPALRALTTGFILALLLVPRAWAQPPAPAAPGNATNTARSNCDAFTPQGTSGAQGATLVSVRITADGQMLDPQVFQSSGDSQLDNAALSCANGYHIGYVSVGGRPADVRWVLAHNWGAHGSGFGPAHPPGTQNKPCRSDYQPNQIPNGATTVSYRIAPDGTVRDATVTESSGVPVFDSSVVDCVSAWRFFPVTQNGQPVEAGQNIQVNWGNGTGSGSL